MAYVDLDEDDANLIPLLRPLHSDLQLTFASGKLTLREFAEDFVNLLPLLVHVKDGYCSYNEKDFTLSSGEIYRVTHLLKQRRVVVKDESQRLLSIPTNHSLKFTVLQKGQKYKVSTQPKTLEEILGSIYYKHNPQNTYISPVRDVQKEGEELVFWDGADEEVTMETMNNLQIIDTYDEKYMVGNGILDEEVTLISTVLPIWLPAKVEVINGFCGESNEHYQTFLDHLDIVLKDIKNHTTPGNKEIMLFEEESDYSKGYEDVRKSHYVSIGQVKRETRHNYEEVQVRREVAAPQVTLREKKTNSKSSSSSGKRSSKNFGDGSILKSIRGRLPSLRKLSLQRTPKTQMHSQDQTFQDETETSQTSYESIGTQNRPVHMYEAIHPQNPPDIPPRTKTSGSSIRKPPASLPQELDSSASSSYDRGDTLLYSKQRSGEVIRRNSEPSENSQQAHQATGNTTRYSSRHSVTSSNPEAWGELDIPVARSQAYKVWTLPSRDTCQGVEDPLYATHKDVKKPVKKMSIKEVGGALVLLKLEKYVQDFKDNDIDGALLVQLTEEILKQDFGFSGLEATKLREFAKGWRLNPGK